MTDSQYDLLDEESQEIISFLENLRFFSIFSNEDMKFILSLGRFKQYQKDTSIIVECENTQGIAVILSGAVSVYKSDPESHHLIRLAHMEKGAIFGELSLISRSPRSATVTADRQTKTFELEKEEFTKFIDSKDLNLQLDFYKNCALDLAERFRLQNDDYLNAQRLLWKKTFKRSS